MTRFRAFVSSQQWVFRLLLILLPLASPGCIAFYTYHPTLVTVRDAETGAPIPHAQVRVGYLVYMTLNAPSSAVGETGPDGTVSIRTATMVPDWDVSAEGYLISDYLSRGLIQRTSPRQLDVRLYRQPKPSITVIVPTGYRGPLKIDKTLLETYVQEKVGKRQFEYEVSPKGYVHFDATPLLLRFDVPVKARYANGETITSEGYLGIRGMNALRWITTEGARNLYVVGTEEDEQAVLSRIYVGNLSKRVLDEKAFAALFEER